MPNVTFCIARQHAWSHFNVRSLKSASEVDEIVDAGLKNMSDRQSFLKQGWDWRIVIDAYMVWGPFLKLWSFRIRLLRRWIHWSVKQVHRVLLYPLSNWQKSPDWYEKWRNKMKVYLIISGCKKSIHQGLPFYFCIIPRLTDVFTEMVGCNCGAKCEFWGIPAKSWRWDVEEVLLNALWWKCDSTCRSLQRFQRLSTNEGGRQLRNSLKITWLSQRQLCFQPNFDQENFKPIEEQASSHLASLLWLHCNIFRINSSHCHWPTTRRMLSGLTAWVWICMADHRRRHANWRAKAVPRMAFSAMLAFTHMD